MQTPLYLKDEGSSSDKLPNPSLAVENMLNLLPEHFGEIGSAFIQQLSLADLNKCDVRILAAIYSQTIGFNKREDDMNGRRLQQLTGIRPDHANESVRRLERWQVIITHTGKYGKWMSINFDFANWGKMGSESQTNDPRCLLSACYQPLTVQDEEQLIVHVLPQLALKEATIEPKIQQQQTISSPSVSSTASSPASSLASPSVPVITDPIPLPVQVVPVKEAIVPAKQQEKTEVFELHFPESLPKQLCKKIARYLKEIKIPEQAQRLLDYFASCLQKGNIRSPFAYFIGLKNRLLKGQLDLPEDQTIVENTKKEQLTLNELRYEYQDAVTDKERLKQQVETVSTQHDCTFEQALERIGYTSIWQKAEDKLEKIKQSLQTYYQDKQSVGI